MSPPATILLGGVSREPLARVLDGDKSILFEKAASLLTDEGKTDAVLVVLGQDQNPKEVAETILWALR